MFERQIHQSYRLMSVNLLYLKSVRDVVRQTVTCTFRRRRKEVGVLEAKQPVQIQRDSERDVVGIPELVHFSADGVTGGLAFVGAEKRNSRVGKVTPHSTPTSRRPFQLSPGFRSEQNHRIEYAPFGGPILVRRVHPRR